MPVDKNKELPESFKSAISYVNKELIGFANIPESERRGQKLDSPLDAQAVYEQTIVPAIKKGELTPKKQEEKKPGLLKRLLSRKNNSKDTRDDDQKLFDSVSSFKSEELMGFMEKKFDVERIKARRDFEIEVNGMKESNVEKYVIESLRNGGKAPVAKEVVKEATKKESKKINAFSTENLQEQKTSFSDAVKSRKFSSRKSGSFVDSIKESDSFLDSIRESDDEHKEMAK